MHLPEFSYVAAQSIEEASILAAELGDKCVIMAGGTDVIIALKEHALKPQCVLDIKGIPGMDQLVYFPGEGLRVGALTKLHTIETSSIVQEKFRAVADAAHCVACVQIRDKATMAGNICNASPCADTAPILLALNASIKTFRTGPDNGRTILMADFFRGYKKTDLTRGEILMEIDIPELKTGECAAYIKHTFRKAMDVGIVGVAVWLKMDRNQCIGCRIGLGGAAPNPIRANRAEQLLIGHDLTDELISQVSVAASGECLPRHEVGPRKFHRVSPEYRKDMIRVFTKRSIKKALETINA